METATGARLRRFNQMTGSGTPAPWTRRLQWSAAGVVKPMFTPNSNASARGDSPGGIRNEVAQDSHPEHQAAHDGEREGIAAGLGRLQADDRGSALAEQAGAPRIRALHPCSWSP